MIPTKADCDAYHGNDALTADEIATAIAKARASISGGIYPIVLVYRQEFTRGTMVGVGPIMETLPFCNEADALSWVAAINAREARGANNYRVVAHHVDVDATLLAKQAAWLELYNTDRDAADAFRKANPPMRKRAQA